MKSGPHGVQMYLPEFAADPHSAYREMRRQYGSLAPVELSPGVPATLVLGYRTALGILNDPEHFPADPRGWQSNAPADCPVVPVMGWRPTGARCTGPDLQRYRQAIGDSMGKVDMYAMRAAVENIAVPLIDSFCQTGTADLIRQYAFPLIFGVVNVLLGCPPAIGQRFSIGMASFIEAIDTEDRTEVDAEDGDRMMSEAGRELVTLKRTQPGNDVTSLLIQHPSKLDEQELTHLVLSHYGAGIELEQNLIANTLLLMLTDDRFGQSVVGGTLSTRDVLDEVLFNDPPLANHLITYPRQPILVEDTWLPAHQPVVISIAACNNDPAIRTEDRTGNRSHLAWGIGPHSCPAQSLAYLIAQDAIDQLLDVLPEMRLSVPADAQIWRPGPFHRALKALPVTFPPVQR